MCVWFSLSYPVILSIENHCSIPQQKKMAQYLIEILGDKLDVSNIKVDESGRLPSPESLKCKILVKVRQLSLVDTQWSTVWMLRMWRILFVRGSTQALVSSNCFIIWRLNLSVQLQRQEIVGPIEAVRKNVWIWRVGDEKEKQNSTVAMKSLKLYMCVI